MSHSPIRSGLPRTISGSPWPGVGSSPIEPAARAAAREEAVSSEVVGEDGERSSPKLSPARKRRGLPRIESGKPWPSGDSADDASASGTQGIDSPTPPLRRAEGVGDTPTESATGMAPRRGLPRTPGGEAWPADDAVVAPFGESPRAEAPLSTVPAASTEGAAAPVASAPPTSDGAAVTSRKPLSMHRSAWPGRAASAPRDPRAQARRYGPFTIRQWVGVALVGGLGLVFAAGMAVLAVRWFLSLDVMREWLAAYPGEYHLPDGAPVGFPAWLGWQHFLNTFFMLLIIRSGLQVRRETRPGAYWTPRWNRDRKISLSLWFHQSLDILWLLNGVLFIALLFISGQWMRIVPTSWEVVPNAVSALLQYISLDWPTENGWVNYNALQQIAYFVTVFVAAPLAVLSGIRMSGIWPKNAKALSRAYPVEWARAVHYPTMVYFVVFIVIHVFLVLATGALRNLNHMYAMQGSGDPDAYADNWAGFWFFAASLAVLAGAWVAARPVVLAPIARLFGTVSGR
ncbi:MAG TPA: hypothetical protein DEA69_06685 [Microbacterium sp.]|nr:hypothetical protein [Microbacterium sp.]HBS08468.1 hypothetical protein [Microbacterium sp.]